MPLRPPAIEQPSSSEEFIPDHPSYLRLKKASEGCRACHLYKDATQTVFGEGSKTPKIFLIGEQPGDREDLEGHPFVGPAGKLLDRALEAAGINRKQTYVTNAVKHFKFKRTGKRRLHEKPNGVEVKACIGWLREELKLLEPPMVICLGSTAAQALLGSSFQVTEQRGKILGFPLTGGLIMATLHPSALLRMSSEEEREEEFAYLVEALKKAKEAIGGADHFLIEHSSNI